MSGLLIYNVRCFGQKDMLPYKNMRLEALQTEPGVFSSTYVREIAFSDDEWINRLIAPQSACFGLYCNDELIGITGIVIDKEKSELAHMTQSYIRKDYRGRGLSGMLYDARIKWAEDKGVKQLVIGHRASNLISKAANQRYGFVYSFIAKQPTGRMAVAKMHCTIR